jgi:CzcA family heavy metal efflux pump
MFNRLIAWSLHNRLLVLALALVAFVAGAYVLQNMQVDVFPEFAPPQVVIQTEAPGMAPLDVESQITQPLESAINGSPGVVSVRSRSAVGLSTVIIVFDADSDIHADRQQVAERLGSVVGSLPATAKPPALLPLTSAVGWLVKYALVSDTKSPEELRTLSDWEIRPRLLALGGIASVESLGGEVRQYQVRVDPQRLQAYRVTLEDVRQALQRANSNVPGAFIAAPGQELIVNGIGRIASLEDVRHTVIVLRKGVPITIANVAEVGIGGEIKRGDAAYGMKNAVIGTVSKAYGADTLATTRRVEEALASIKASLPPDVTLHAKVFRQASFIEAAVHNLEVALLQGALIVVAVLFVFLMNWRASFVTFVSMPASFVGGLLAMHALGVGINSMTLGGLAIAIGEVVDNGIITVENVLHRLRANRALAQPRGALVVVFDAVREIANSVIYATAIIVLVFVPIFFLQDLAGSIFAPLGIAYIASVSASLLVAVTLVPALCYLMLARTAEKRGDEATNLEPTATLAPLPPGEEAASEPALVRGLKSLLTRVLEWALPRFGWVTGLSALALAGALALLPLFGFSFLPEFKEGNFIIAMTTLPGTSLDESMRVGGIVRRELLKYPQVVSINQRAGRSELDEDAQTPNFSEFDLQLDFDRDRSMPADELLARIRADLGKIPGVSFNVGQFIAHRMDEVQSGVRSQVAVKIYGEDLATLYKLGLQAQGLVRTIPGVVDVNLEQQVTVPQVTIRIDREKAARYGINVGDVADDIETALNGEAVTSVLEGSRRFDLTVRLKGSSRQTLADLRDVPVDAPALGAGGGKIPLRLVAQVGLEDQPYAISRENVHRLVVLGFNVEDRSLGAVIGDTRARIGKQLRLPPGYYVEYGGQFESQQQANRTLLGFGALALFGAVLLLFKAFGNLREAWIVLFNLPLALIGGIVALFVAGASMSVAAVIGFITLFGIATRNGIILVSHYNQLRREGRSLEEVVRRGTLDRLVPVLMTATTAALGLLPLLFGSPVGKELEVPLAQVVLGGLISATLLNLVVVPTVYLRVESAHARRRAALSHPRLQESSP